MVGYIFGVKDKLLYIIKVKASEPFFPPPREAKEYSVVGRWVYHKRIFKVVNVHSVKVGRL